MVIQCWLLRPFISTFRGWWICTTTHLPTAPRRSTITGTPSIVKPLWYAEKVLKKINFQISKNDIEHIITCTPESIERMLLQLKRKIEVYL